MRTYEWDPTKAATNLEKHEVTFEEATTVFGDPLAGAMPDPDYPEREITLGQSDRQRLLVVVSVQQDATIRIISARKATRRERKQYEQGKAG